MYGYLWYLPLLLNKTQFEAVVTNDVISQFKEFFEKEISHIIIRRYGETIVKESKEEDHLNTQSKQSETTNEQVDKDIATTNEQVDKDIATTNEHIDKDIEQSITKENKALAPAEIREPNFETYGFAIVDGKGLNFIETSNFWDLNQSRREVNWIKKLKEVIKRAIQDNKTNAICLSTIDNINRSQEVSQQPPIYTTPLQIKATLIPTLKSTSNTLNLSTSTRSTSNIPQSIILNNNSVRVLNNSGEGKRQRKHSETKEQQIGSSLNKTNPSSYTLDRDSTRDDLMKQLQDKRERNHKENIRIEKTEALLEKVSQVNQEIGGRITIIIED